MAIVISGSGIDMGGNPVSNASQIEVQEEQVSPFSGFKNYIINGKKTINQRGLTSTDNSYNQDRWYKAGNNRFQGIEGGNNLISGKTYTLSWEGIATASYYVGTATSSTINAQAFTPITNGGNFTLTITAGQNLWIKFASDATGSTFNFVQLEEGSVATPFEHRPYGLELSLCQRYLPAFSGAKGVGSALNSNGNSTATDKRYSVDLKFPVETRVPPTGYVISNISHFSIGEGTTITETAVSSSFNTANIYFCSLSVNGSSTTVGKEGRPSRLIANNTNALIYFTGCEL